MLSQEIPFANAYRLEDEPYYYELHAIFGDDNIQQPEAIPLEHSSEEEDSVESDVTDE
ncbi:UNVERIFIED_CONTAM: hypothetical protein Slati_1357600 [Sesamum latifolium]|uniref:Uncharacterized protein n=1 Tax=Sesamum latifolium TaxID=2727402 RepID=A0AAW2XPR0_9LAMI